MSQVDGFLRRGLNQNSKHAKRALALAAAVASLSVFGAAHRAAAGTWTDAAPLDPGVVDTGANNLFTSTTPVKDGDVIKVGGTTAGGLTTQLNYYVVGVGSTPSTTFKLSLYSPSSTLVAAGTSGAVATTLVPEWFTSSDWGGGVPNAVDAVATLGTGGSPLVNTAEVALNGNATIGTLNFNSANNLSLISTIVGNAGPLATLNFATSSGTPTITVSGGGSMMLSDANTLSGGVPTGINQGNNQARLSISGTQGLVIDNQNPILPVTTSSATTLAASSPGAFRFGYQLDWSRFSGPLTLKEGAFALDGATSSNNLSGLPLNNDVILGTGTSAAQLELTSNQGNGYVRGLDGNAQSKIINEGASGGPSLTLGSYSQPGETYTFNGSVGGDAVFSSGVALELTGRLRFVKIGASTQVMNGRMEMTSGALLGINGGTFSLGTAGAMGTSFDANGQGTSTYAVALPGTPASTNLDANNIWMHNGELKMDGTGLSYPRTQNFGALIQGNGGDSSSNTSAGNNFSNASSGLSTFTLVAGAGQPITLTFAGIRARDQYGETATTGNANGITYLFRGTGLGTNAPGTAASGTANVIFTNVFLPGSTTLSGGTNTPTTTDTVSGLGITGTVGTPTYGVMKGALADTSATGTGAGFATYEQSGDNGSTTTFGVRVLAASEQQVVSDAQYNNTAGSGNLNPATAATQNALLAVTAPASITGITTQTLQIDNSSGSAQTVTNTGTALYASEGMLFSGSSALTLTGGTITGTASASNNEDVVILSINSAGTTIASAVSNSGAASHAGWITYGGSGNFTITGTQTTGNSGGIALNSTGTTVLNGTLAGDSVLAINQGTVQLGANFVTANTVNVQIAAGTTLDLNGLSTTIGTLNASAAYGSFVNNQNNAAGTVTNAAGNPTSLLILGGVSGTQIFPGVIQGNISLQIGRVGGTAFTQDLNGVNTYTGTTTVMNGSTLNIPRYGQLPSTTMVTLGDATNTAGTLSLGDTLSSGTLVNGPVNQTIAGLFTAGTAATSAVVGADINTSILTVNYTGGSPDTYGGVLGSSTAGVTNNLTLRKTGSGILALTGAGANFYTGGTIVEGGILSIARDNQLGGIGAVAPGLAAAPTPASVVADNVILNGGTLQATGTFTLGDSFSATTPAVPNKRGIGIGPVQGGVGGTGTIDVTSGNVLTDNAPITSAGNTGTNNLTKTDLGSLVLGGASTYNGTTTVSAGKLLVNGSIQGSAVAVQSTGLLGGSGVVGLTSTLVSVSGGGTIAPGNSIGTLTIGTGGTGNGVAFAGSSGNNALYSVEIDGSGTNASDLLAVNGNIDLSSSFDELDIAMLGGSTPTGTYTIATYSGSLTGTFDTVSGLPSGYQVDYSQAGSILLDSVPEPTSLGLLGLATMGLLSRRRRSPRLQTA